MQDDVTEIAGGGVFVQNLVHANIDNNKGGKYVRSKIVAT